MILGTGTGRSIGWMKATEIQVGDILRSPFMTPHPITRIRPYTGPFASAGCRLIAYSDKWGISIWEQDVFSIPAQLGCDDPRIRAFLP